MAGRSMLTILRRRLASSELLSFNPVLRDRWVARQAAQLPAGARVLDAGAGSCPYRPLFAHCRYQTQDAAVLQGEQLRQGEYGAIDYVCDAAAVPVDDGTFDAILCTEMLEHHPEPIRVVGEFSRILKPGGRLILTAPLGSGLHQEPYHFYGGYTPFWYRKFLAEAGFKDIDVEPNAGSLRFFAQEGIRFLRQSVPANGSMPFWLRVVWAPFWLTLVPLLGLIVPLAARAMDPYDQDRRFTVGYHVTATRCTVAEKPR